MSSLTQTPPTVRPSGKRRGGWAALPLFDVVSPSGRELPRANKASTDPNAYLARLNLFDRQLIENPPLVLISLFCGGGGLDLGLAFAGFHSRVVTDIAPSFVDTVTSNLPRANGLKEDALALNKEQLHTIAGTKRIDLVAAGPPCQSFSILGRRGALADPRGKLTLKYFEIVAEIKPKAFLFENVPGLLNVNKGEDWRRLIDHAQRRTGYHLHWAKLNAVKFGIPQFRERVFLVGFRENVAFQFPASVTGPGAEELRAALKLEGRDYCPSAWALENVRGIPNHDIREHGSRVRDRYRKLEPGGRDKTDHTDRIDPERPAGTVLVGSAAGGGRPHIHPTEPRVITVREAARLQGFPDWYVFRGTSTGQYRQVGNAVPPLLAYEVGKKIAEAVKKIKGK